MENSFKMDETEKQKLLLRVSSRIFNTPLMVTPDRLQVILSAVGSRFGIIADHVEYQEYGKKGERVEISSKFPVAIISVYDTLVYQTKGLMTLSGLTSYERIRAEHEAALADDTIEEIVYRIASPGGEVSGNFDLVDYIYSTRGIKPITAIVDDYAFSAGYSIASAADKIYIPRTGSVGSIGVIAVHVDQSEYDKKEGFKYTAIYSGDKKNSFSPHEPISEATFKEVKARVDSTRELFVDTVARNRGLSASLVKNTEAGVYQGAEGVQIGLADEIASWHEVMETITKKYKGGKTMANVSQSKTDADSQSAVPEVETVAVKGMDSDNLVETAVEESGVVTDKMWDTLQGEIASLKNECVQLRSDLDTANEKTQKALDEKREMEILTEIKGLKIVGDQTKLARTLFSLEKVDPELYAEEMDRVRQTSEALEKTKLFDEIGSSADGKQSAYDEIQVKVAEYVKQGMTEIEANRKVMAENPGLYRRYRNEK